MMRFRPVAFCSAASLARFVLIVSVSALLPLSSCVDQDVPLDILGAGSGGLGGSGTGGGGSAGMASGGAGGMQTAGTGGASGAGAGAGAGGDGGTGGLVGDDPDAGDASTPDGGGGISFDCPDSGADSACALCQVWTQLTECQPTATCPDEQRDALLGLGCDAEYAAYLACFANEPVTSSTCAPGPSTILADARLGGTGTENGCQSQECALYDCLGALDPAGCP